MKKFESCVRSMFMNEKDMLMEQIRLIDEEMEELRSIEEGNASLPDDVGFGYDMEAVELRMLELMVERMNFDNRIGEML